MEQIQDNLNSEISFTEIKYENLSFLRQKARRSSTNKIEKTPNKDSSLINLQLIPNPSTKELSIKSKSEDTKTGTIEEKWGLVDQSFKMFLEIGKMIEIDENLIVNVTNLKNKIESIIEVHKEDITKTTVIDETTAVDILLCEIKSFLTNSLKSKNILEEFDCTNPFITALYKLYVKKKTGLRKLIEPLFNLENTENNELLKILKIDYFQKCIDDKTFPEKCLLNVLNLREKDLYTLDLNHICLPFIENGRLTTYAEFMIKIFESESFLQAMYITMNYQSDTVHSKDKIKNLMTEIYDYLLYPVVFPNKQESHLYAVTCINLKLYLSSFVVTNIEKDWKKVLLGLDRYDDEVMINGLKKKMSTKLSIGFNFANLILTIMHESSHILRRHLIEPKVYMNTEEIEKDELYKRIDGTSAETKNTDIIHVEEKMNEGGNILEYLLFGDNFTGLIIQEIQYLFNLDNWNKNLKNFREDFTNIRKLMDHRCIKSKEFMNKYIGRSFRGFCGNQRNKPCC